MGRPDRASNVRIRIPSGPRSYCHRPARVGFVMAAPVASIPDELMAYEHEDSCRSKEGLLAAMGRVFGEVRSDEKVTVIGFEM